MSHCLYPYLWGRAAQSRRRSDLVPFFDALFLRLVFSYFFLVLPSVGLSATSAKRIPQSLREIRLLFSFYFYCLPLSTNRPNKKTSARPPGPTLAVNREEGRSFEGSGVGTTLDSRGGSGSTSVESETERVGAKYTETGTSTCRLRKKKERTRGNGI